MASLPFDQTAFKAGDVVHIANRPAIGHCRVPVYLRGQTGVIAEVLGKFRDPTRLAYHRPGWPAQVLYKVRFCQADLWPAYPGPPDDMLDADIYEDWLHVSKDATPEKPPRD